MNISIEVIVAIALPTIGAIVWLVRLEGQVKDLRTLRDGDLRLAEANREADNRLTATRMTAIGESLEKIDKKLEVLDALARKVDQLRSFIGGGGAPHAARD